MSNPVESVVLYAKAVDGQSYPAGLSTPVAATQTLTLAANATDGETFGIGPIGSVQTYTWKTTLGSAINQILIAGSASDSIDNAIVAINEGIGDGISYTSQTRQNKWASAAAGAGDTMVVTARETGGEGNNITTTDTMANGSWGGTTLAGGAYGSVFVDVTVSGGGDATAANQALQLAQETATVAALNARLGIGYSAQTTITRPSNTTAYADGDVVGATAAAITFASIGPAAGFININDADLRIDVTSVPAGMTTFRLHLYNVTPPSALADNAAWDLPSGDRAAYLGYIDLATPTDLGSTLFVQTGGNGYKEIAMGATTSLFAYLQTITGFTPASATVLAVRLNARGV